MIVKIKAINDIKSPKGLVIVRAGQIAQVLNHIADEAVKNGDATFVDIPNPIDIKKNLKKKIENGND
jgi:hypothetical protein